MKKIKFTLFISLNFLLSIPFIQAQQGGKLKMWYNKPASVWNEALPIGNGRLGAMVYGDPAKEQIQLNEGTFWSGGPSRNDNSKALSVLSTVRQNIFNGDYSSAGNLANSNIVATTLHGSIYQVLGNLNLAFTGNSSYSNYYRELDLENAKFTTTFNANGVTYKREVFASQPDQVIVVRLTASVPGKLTFTASFDGSLKQSVKAVNTKTLEMTGLSSTHEGVTGQVKFDARAKIINTGGSTAISGSSIKVTSANEVVILISIATNFVDYQTITDNEVTKCTAYLSAAETKSYSNLVNNHIAAYQKYFNRVSFDLGTSQAASFPTDIRIKNFSKTTDPELVTKYYQFGRYLLISCSQPGGQPATLQGLWNNDVYPSWDSKYTININTEMNYWPSEKCNLTEMNQPLIKMVQELSVAGQQTAKGMYGCNGWVAHHNSDIWRTCGVVDFADAGMWPMGGAWLSQHLWEKYLYSGDKLYLDSVYPVLKSACQFYQDFLIEEPVHKWLVVSPSMSPENTPSGHSSALSAGTTMDNQLLFDLFTKTIKAASVLNKDSALMVEFQSILGKLAPMQVGSWGQLQEWMKDWDSKTDQNRHVSHLYGLFPSNQISPYTSPKLSDAARTSLIYRGDASTGWSMGWKINLWARLLDGNHARKLITDQLTYVDPVSGSNGGTYPNFFDAHPPFQIDGNFGCTSGITEMLLQSQDGAIHFLPALPDDWATGSISGLRAYGGFDVNFNFENGKIQKITIKSNLGGNCRIRVPNEVALEDGTLLSQASGDNPNSFFANAQIKTPLIANSSLLHPFILKKTYLYDLSTQVGQTYTIERITSLTYKYASVSNKNPKQISVDLSETVKKQSSYGGFSVKVDSTVVTVDSVVMGDTTNRLVIYLKDSIVKDSKVLLSYSSGDVVSKFGVSLTDFAETLVDNLLEGSAPRVIKLESSKNGDTIVARFNKKMIIPADLSAFTLSAKYNGSKSISITKSAFSGNDSTLLAFTLAERVYAGYTLTLSYSGSSAVSADSGTLNTFANMSVTNNSDGLPFKISSGTLDSKGAAIELKFAKPLAVAIEQSGYFTLKANGVNVAISDMDIAGTITLKPTLALHYGDIVTISYTPGNITATDNGALESFTDFAISNLVTQPSWTVIPGKIEAENYFSQFGVQTETTGDTGGGLNVGWIDTGDWLEYAINNTTTDTDFTAGFRMASQNGGGIVAAYLDNVKIGQVSCPSTGGWQTYQSINAVLKIAPGKHYLKLYATNAGFNINYIDIKKKVTGINEPTSKNFNVYPIPGSRELIIESEDFNFNKIEIRNLMGSVVLSRSIAYMPKLHLPISLPDGMYIVTISNEKQFQLKKVVVKCN